jgi:predicted GNAT superfamily acetyltransferase
VLIRPLDRLDLDAALALNNANLPAVGEVDAAELARLHGMATVALAAEVDGRFAGFCLVFGPGADYASPNYRWFSARYDEFAYLDRIAVDESARRVGVGRALYAALVERLGESVPVLLCEVNLVPRNDVSLAFHASVGFDEVGRQHQYGDEREVSMLALELPRNTAGIR